MDLQINPLGEPASAEQLHRRAIALAQQGRWDEAIADFRRVVEIQPDHAGAYNNWGLVLTLQGKLDEATACYRRALQWKPDFAEAYSNLGRACMSQGRTEEAVTCFRRSLELKPGFAEAHNRLGLALREQGNREEAAACFRRALQANPALAEAHNNLGISLNDQGSLDEAIACYRRALELKPGFAQAHQNLGVAVSAQGKLDEAIACCRRALELKPDFAQAYDNLGTAVKDRGNLDEAIACYRRAIELKPDFAEAHSNLGVALNARGDMDEAIACYRRALELKPDFAGAYSNLGIVLTAQGKLDDAVACYRRALELKPDFAETHNNLGAALKDQGKQDEALACCRRALELKPDFPGAHSNLLLTLHYATGVTPAALAEAHAEYDRRYAAPLRGEPGQPEIGRVGHGRLRLGFLSPDLGRHPVGYFLVRVLENLDPQRHETVCYSDRAVHDNVTARFQAAATQWRDVFGTSDQRLASQIRADCIDILFDLAGHTSGNRLLVFARKPAPIQVSWAGYVGTTGLEAIAYLLADRWEVPPGAERHYREQVLRMPDGYVCYDPPLYAPAVTPLPALDRGQVTLASFNNPAKITPQVIEVWAKILRRLPGARLVLKFKGQNEGGVARRFLDLFAAQAIDPGRLELLGGSPHAEFLAEYQRVDLALDPFPYNGGLTTCEALWMGVPVVTCPGETFASRHSLSHLSNGGLTETIAGDLDEYVELAVSLSADLPRLAVLRSGLRARMAASPLCDGKRFAGNLASILRDVWEKGQAGQAPRA